MTKTFEILNFGHWNLFVICDLVLGFFFEDSTIVMYRCIFEVGSSVYPLAVPVSVR
jgi:hypothetical protein